MSLKWWARDVERKYLGRVVVVKWRDANSPANSWVHLDKFKPSLATCLSVGFLSYVDEEKLALLCDLTSNEDNGNVEVQGNPSIVIPSCQILDVAFPNELTDYISLCYNGCMEENADVF